MRSVLISQWGPRIEAVGLPLLGDSDMLVTKKRQRKSINVGCPWREHPTNARLTLDKGRRRKLEKVASPCGRTVGEEAHASPWNNLGAYPRIGPIVFKIP